VTLTLPAVIEAADLREGTPAIEAVVGETYTLGTLPAGIIVTGVCIVVTDVMGTGVTLKSDMGSAPLVAAADCATVGLTMSTTTDPVLLTTATDVTAEITGNPTGGSVSVVIDYTDYERATMSYIGEQ